MEFNRGNFIGDVDTHKVATTIKCIAFNGSNTAGDVDIGKAAAFVKCIRSNRGNPFFDDDCFYVFIIIHNFPDFV